MYACLGQITSAKACISHNPREICAKGRRLKEDETARRRIIEENAVFRRLIF